VKPGVVAMHLAFEGVDGADGQAKFKCQSESVIKYFLQSTYMETWRHGDMKMNFGCGSRCILRPRSRPSFARHLDHELRVEVEKFPI
jgi:hypothetical protein